jgi:hypothetical protein
MSTECIRYFIPTSMRGVEITEADEQKFVAYDSNGLYREETTVYPVPMNGFHALLQGKIWRGRMVAEYEQGVLEGTVPYIDLLREEDSKPIPRYVAEFLAGQMFKGMDREKIIKLYETGSSF